MKQNPVYNREMRVSSRSMKLPLIIFLFNGILFLVTLLNMYSVIMQVKASAVSSTAVLWNYMNLLRLWNLSC